MAYVLVRNSRLSHDGFTQGVRQRLGEVDAGSRNRFKNAKTLVGECPSIFNTL
jgi:hypothetical protein